MNYTDIAIEALKGVEATLRDIITQALAAQAYRDVAKMAGAADSVAAIVSELNRDAATGTLLSPPSITQPQLPNPANQQVVAKAYGIKIIDTPDSDPEVDTKLASPFSDGHTVARQVSNVASRRDGYPRFLREGDKLLKVAWSKKERKPYEHRAPKAVIQTLIDAVRKRKGEGKLFEAAQVLPLAIPNGEEYPSYQSYLALSWLRHVGVVTKMGREGYVLKPGASTPDKVERLWASLPTAE